MNPSGITARWPACSTTPTSVSRRRTFAQIRGWCESRARSPGKYKSTRLSGQVVATCAALLIAAAPPPTTITDVASVRRACAARNPSLISLGDCRFGVRQNPLVTPVEMISASYSSSDDEQPVGGRDQSADGSRIRTGGGVRARRW
jgi:hypothetical protein